MTAIIGTFALGLALAVALYGCVASFVAGRSRNAVLVESARTCALSLLALVVAAHGAMPAATLSNAPADGQGPLPLLQNHPLMAIHPPMLYLGFIGMTVPFAFAVAALLTGRLSDHWIRVTRRWTLFAWICLTAGLVLGALWSYAVPGWGGYWAWDPVENIALLPWLTST